MTPVFTGQYNAAQRLITLDNPMGEVVTLVLSRDAAICFQDLPKRVQIEIGKARRIKSHPYNNYYWGHVIPRAARNECHHMTDSEAHRFLLDNCAKRDRFGRPIRMSDGDFTLMDQLEYVQTCRDFMAREMNVQTMDPDPNWRNHGRKEKEEKARTAEAAVSR